MATLDDIRRIALALPEVYEAPNGHTGRPTWRVKKDYLVWERLPTKSDLKQLERLGREWPSGTIGAVHVEGENIKEALVSTWPDVFFTIPHFEGYPAVLFHLDRIDLDHLEELIIETWLDRAPRRIVKAWLAEHRPDE